MESPTLADSPDGVKDEEVVPEGDVPEIELIIKVWNISISLKNLKTTSIL